MHHDFFRLNPPDYASLEIQREYFNFIPPLIKPPLKWSDNIWVSQRDGWTALYRPLNMGLFYIRQDCGDNPDSDIDDGWKQRWIQRLISEKFIHESGNSTDSTEHRKLIESARKGRFRFICLLPTTKCGLRCAYCHQNPGDGKGIDMTGQDFIRGMMRCAELCDDLSKPVDILLYGGEPLKAFHITEQLLKLTTSRKKIFSQEVRVSFTTSGMGLTDDIVEIMAKNNIFVIVSLDGSPQVNDAVRKMGRKGSSCDIAEKAFIKLKNLNCRAGLSVTMGTHNVRNFKDNVEYLLERFKPNDIGLNAFLHPINNERNPFQTSIDDAFPAFIEAFNLTKEYGVYAEQPFRRLKPFAFRKPLLKDCSSPGERLVLAPGGLMGFCDSCYPTGEHFYPIEDFPGYDSVEYETWVKLSSPEMPDCRECPAMTVCGGACRYDAYRASGRWDGVDPERCKFERAFLNHLIWDLFDKTGIHSEPVFVPQDADRAVLFGNVSLKEENQPFIAGSYL